MAGARFDQVGVDIEAVSGASTYGLRATGQTLVFDGFLKLYREGRDDEKVDEDAESNLPELTAEQALRMLEVPPAQHATPPPTRAPHAAPARARGVVGQGARGGVQRPAVDVRVDHLDDPRSRVCPPGGSALQARGR